MGGQKAGFTRWFERGEIEKKKQLQHYVILLVVPIGRSANEYNKREGL